MTNLDVLTILEQRLGRQHARDRLRIEKEHESEVFGQGMNFFRFENLPLSHVVMCAVLMATGLNRIESPLLPKAFDGFTIVQLSDLKAIVHVQLRCGQGGPISKGLADASDEGHCENNRGLFSGL